jgi:hypothetical protein
MKTKYTKAQRHAIYKKALKFYREGIKDPKFTYGLCYVIEKAAGTNCENYSELFPFFPEWIKQMPQVHPDNYWWKRSESAPRIAALKAMIKQTAPKKKK